MSKRKETFNPWERSAHPDREYRLSAEEVFYSEKLVHKRPKFDDKSSNIHCDYKTKRAGIYASASVVALVSYTGDDQLFESSGTIIEANEHNIATVITSANLIRLPTKNNFGENSLADHLKVVVHTSDYDSYEAEICVYDFHYNLLVVKFRSDKLVLPARLGAIDDCSTLKLYQRSFQRSFQLRSHSTKRLVPEGNDAVISVGRYFTKPFDLMVAPGYFRRDRCRNDCKELFTTTCHITRCGDGGPLVNLSGEIIGINFYEFVSDTPFLPINIVKKWWDHYKRRRELYHPYLGFDATNLYVADVDLIERVLRYVPSISDGVIVERVIPESSAHLAGLRKDDVIVKCNRKTVAGFLQLLDIVWNNAGGTVELAVARAECSSLLNFRVAIVEATPDKMNSWPRWEHW